MLSNRLCFDEIFTARTVQPVQDSMLGRYLAVNNTSMHRHMITCCMTSMRLLLYASAAMFCGDRGRDAWQSGPPAEYIMLHVHIYVCVCVSRSTLVFYICVLMPCGVRIHRM